MSASSVNVGGAYNDNEHVVETERVMIAHAAKVAVLADHSKIGKSAMCHIAGLEKLDFLITDRAPASNEFLAACAMHDVRVIIA